jgi:hypothetical protein
MYNSVLQRLWELAEQKGRENGTDAEMTFAPIGLWLLRSDDDGRYLSTPVNSCTFAKTGGDGVHYSLLWIGGEVTDESPVIMTVPCMPEEGNLIVGENLWDFLRLGCRHGYFDIEQLVYQREVTVRILEERAPGDEIRPEQRALLDLLTTTFSLAPWELVSERLEELGRRFMSSVQLPQDE